MKLHLSFLGLILSCGIASAQTPLLHYTFDEASSGNGVALDSGSGTAANGTFAGVDATRISNTPGSLSALNLTSAANPDYVTAGDADKIDGLSQMTLTAWVNLQGNPAHGNRIMAKQNTASANFDGFSFAYNNPTAGTISSSLFQLNLALGGTSGFVFSTSGANLDAADKWLFVAVTYDGALTGNNLKFYSGSETSVAAQLGSTLTANAGTLVANANDFRVGASSTAGTSAPQLMDDIRVYNSVLDASQLNDIRLQAVPEPSTYALLGGGLTALLVFRRMRKS